MLLKLVAEGCFSAIAASFNNHIKMEGLEAYNEVLKFIYEYKKWIQLVGHQRVKVKELFSV